MLAPKATTSAMCWPSQSMSDTMLQGLPSKRTPERRRAESTWPLTLGSGSEQAKTCQGRHVFVLDFRTDHQAA